MIIWKNTKSYETQSNNPNQNWYEGYDSEVYVIDETTEDGKALAQKIIQYAPYLDFVLDVEGTLIDITPTERPSLPPPEPTPEQQEIEDLKQSVAELSAIVAVMSTPQV